MTRTARQTSTRLGHTKGEPLDYMWGHNGRIHAYGHRVEDRGFETPCYIWTGRVDRLGYGRLRTDTVAHRHSYEAVNGPIPPGMHIDHLCKQPSCVRPEHLAAVTPAEHKRRHSKITQALADEIRAADGSQYAIARRYGVSQGLVWKIKHRLAWA